MTQRRSAVFGIVLTAVLFAVPLHALGWPRLHPRQLDVTLLGGKSFTSWHGQQQMTALEFELPSAWLSKTDFVVGGGFHVIRQPRSWFGHQYGDPDETARGVELFATARHVFGRTFAELGTGPMWSGDQTPAATSHFNMNSRLGVGVQLFPQSRHPMRVGYRFSHISNGGIASRNPGMNLSSLVISMQLERR